MDRLAAYKGKHVFVTGHTGFKGRWLCEWLRMMGADVTGYSLPDEIRDMPRLNAALNETKPQIVFHLAAQSLVRYSFSFPVQTWETNVIGTVNLLTWAKTVGHLWKCRIICVTSDKVYKHTAGYCVEDDELGGVDPYSASKAAAELIIASYRDGFGLNVASARAGNCIGGGDMAPDRLIPDAIRAKEKGEKLIVRNVFARRPWQHVVEPLYGYLLLGLSDIREPFNFGPTESHSVDEVADLVVPKGWIGAVSATDPPESATLLLNSEKAGRMLGWYPRWTFERAIEETMLGYSGKPMAQTIEDYIAS